MKKAFYRLGLIAPLFCLAVMPSFANDQDCFEFCIANKVLCESRGGSWHLDCYDVEGYWIEELHLCNLGVGPCIP